MQLWILRDRLQNLGAPWTLPDMPLKHLELAHLPFSHKPAVRADLPELLIVTLTAIAVSVAIPAALVTIFHRTLELLEVKGV